jgi:hypothetical protein
MESLLLFRRALPSPTMCRFIPALSDHEIPEWNAAKEFFLSVAHSPLDLWQRLRCYGLVVRWMLKYHRRMAKDLLIAADQVLFNFQNRRVIQTKTQPYSA